MRKIPYFDLYFSKFGFKSSAVVVNTVDHFFEKVAIMSFGTIFFLPGFFSEISGSKSHQKKEKKECGACAMNGALNSEVLVFAF